MLATTSARAANVPISQASRRRSAIDAPTTSSIACRLATGTSGSTRRAAARMGAARESGGTDALTTTVMFQACERAM
jgi:hypothetical protein